MARKAKLKRKPTSGTPWNDQDYAARGYGRLNFRIPQDEIDALDALAEKWGIGRQATVRHLIKHSREVSRPPRDA